MDFGPLRAMALELNLQAHGVAITVTPTGADEAITTRGIWLTPISEDVADGMAREPQEIMALRRADFPDGVPRGTFIEAPRYGSDEILNWRVDGTETVETDKIHVILIRAPEE